jgi:hypothetical protein
LVFKGIISNYFGNFNPCLGLIDLDGSEGLLSVEGSPIVSVD